MSRNIVTKRDIQMATAGTNAHPGVLGLMSPAQPPEPPAPNGYFTKLIKYIPTEVISLYVALEAVVKVSAVNPGQSQIAYWIVFGACLVGTPLYLWRLGKVYKRLQLLISTVALAVWVFALGGPFDSYAWYQNNKIYPALILPIYTFFIALIDP